mgnify:FL=1
MSQRLYVVSERSQQPDVTAASAGKVQHFAADRNPWGKAFHPGRNFGKRCVHFLTLRETGIQLSSDANANESKDF